MDENPYKPPNIQDLPSPSQTHNFRGPLLYFASAGLIGAICATPLLENDSTNSVAVPIAHVLLLLSLPLGGLAFRIRSRQWPVDPTVWRRQCLACLTSLLFPLGLAIITVVPAQAFTANLFGGMISASCIVAVLISGQRRGRMLNNKSHEKQTA